MAQATPRDQTNPFSDLTGMLEQFKVPGVDMAAIVESRRKDMDALVATNKAAFESMQGLAGKQAEILAQAMKSLQEGVQSFAKGGGAALDPGQYAEFAQAAYEKAVAQMGELAEMARKAQTDAMAGITARAQESVAEMKKLMQPK